MDIKVLGIDLGKTVCSLAWLDEAGAVVFRKRLQRHRCWTFSCYAAALRGCDGSLRRGASQRAFCLEERLKNLAL